MIKKLPFLFFCVTIALAALSFTELNNTGMPSYTGFAGELTCAHCHSGGSSAASGITITSVPEFTDNGYYPDSTYHITITVQAAGFSRYGFDCEILNDNNTNAGTMKSAGPGVKLIIGTAGRRNAVHTTPKIGSGPVSFTFDWVAPAEGNVNIYTIANAVNGNNSTSGDFVIPKTSLTLYAVDPPEQPNPDGIAENAAERDFGLSVFPNPASGIMNCSYKLDSDGHVRIDVTDLTGRVIRTLINGKTYGGFHEERFDIHDLQGGVYFLQATVDNVIRGRRMVSVY